MTRSPFTSDDPTEPRPELAEALRALDIDRFEHARERFRAWHRSTATDLQSREDWPGYFISATLAMLREYERLKFPEAARIRGWVRHNIADPRFAELAEMLRSTGRVAAAMAPSGRRPGYEVELRETLEDLDADRFAAVTAKYHDWAVAEYEPWPATYTAELGRELVAMEIDDPARLEDLVEFVRASDDERFALLRAAVRARDLGCGWPHGARF